MVGALGGGSRFSSPCACAEGGRPKAPSGRPWRRPGKLSRAELIHCSTCPLGLGLGSSVIVSSCRQNGCPSKLERPHCSLVVFLIAAPCVRRRRLPHNIIMTREVWSDFSWSAAVRSAPEPPAGAGLSGEAPAGVGKEGRSGLRPRRPEVFDLGAALGKRGSGTIAPAVGSG